MLLLLIRHAHAGERDPAQWPDDRDRPLTDKGRKTHRRVSRALRRLDLVPQSVLTSPWVRASQTADIVIAESRMTQPAVPCDPLAEDPDLTRLSEYVGDRTPDDIVAMVGHSPWMEELAAILLGGSQTSLRVDFPKSGVMGIELEALAPGTGELKFLLRPKFL